MNRAPLDPLRIPLSGIHLIEASAGTGKTYTITSLFLRLIAEGAASIDEIVAVTFTNAATAELKDRVQQRLVRATEGLRAQTSVPGDTLIEHLRQLPDQPTVLRRMEAALRGADRAAIMTIHGFAARMLAQHAFESGVREDTELIGDDRGILYDIVTDFWSSHVAPLPREQFALIQGVVTHRSLASVARTVAGAFEVPLATPLEKPDLAGAIERWRSIRAATQIAYQEMSSELLELLLSSVALNRNKYRIASIEKDAVSLNGYFSSPGSVAVDYPDLDKGRWTSSGVKAATKKGHQTPSHALLDVLEDFRTACEELAAKASEFAAYLRGKLALEVEQRLTEEHEELGTQSFDGLLVSLCRALRRTGSGPRLARAIRRRFSVALIDEFQDTDKTQYEIFRRVYQPAPDSSALYLIGDPKQSIYRFRGADVHTYLAAGEDAASAVWTLNTSYRSSPSLIQAQNVLWGRLRRPFAMPQIAYEPIQPRPGAEDRLRDSSGNCPPALRILLCENGDPLRLSACEVARLLDSKLSIDGAPVTPKNIAVLTRTNKQASQVQELLRELEVPAVMHGDRSVFEAPEALELRRILRALAEPSQRHLCRAALATRAMGVLSDELGQMQEDAELLELWTGRLRAFGDLWRSRGVAHALEALAEMLDLTARTLRDVDGERKMTNFRHLLELLNEAEVSEHLGTVGLLRFLDSAIASPTGHAMAAEARQVRLESDEDAVTLTTAHKSKGLEYDIVVLPSVGADEKEFPMSAARYHDPDCDSAERIEVRSPRASEEASLHVAWARQEELEEALRVGYVALTRSRHQVIAVHQGGSQFSPLGWFLHEPSLPEEIQRAVRQGFKELSNAQRENDLERLVTDSEGVIEVSRGDSHDDLACAPRYARPGLTGVSISPPKTLPYIPQGLRTSSFSAMTRTSGSLSRQAREGRDVDEVDQELDLSGQAGEGGTGQLGAERVVLADFPRGARSGDALHAILERVPMKEGTVDQRRSIVVDELQKRGFDADHESAVSEAIEDLLSSLRLLDLDRENRIPEMEFNLRIGEANTLLSGGMLRRALMGTEADPYLSPGYLTRVRDLGFGAFHGFLRGFIDLVFLADQRLYVVDYKSNFLGETYADYAPRYLQYAMEDHHYLLQGLLYAVAVHRYGQQRISGYRYDAHFGGVIYAFLRGVPPRCQAPLDTRETPGIYRFFPSEALLESLSKTLSGGAK